jgi:hypothetical protein
MTDISLADVGLSGLDSLPVEGVIEAPVALVGHLMTMAPAMIVQDGVPTAAFVMHLLVGGAVVQRALRADIAARLITDLLVDVSFFVGTEEEPTIGVAKRGGA